VGINRAQQSIVMDKQVTEKAGKSSNVDIPIKQEGLSNLRLFD
jgi:putative transposon-encoded protein